MFTGIVEITGEVMQIDRLMGDHRFTIQTPESCLKSLEPGGSISVSGICLTVVEKLPHGFTADVSTETMTRTTASGWHAGRIVNLENAATLQKPLGGHLVSGHVDGVARLLSRCEESRSLRLLFEVSGKLARYIAPKGSVTLDGVSLTVNGVDECQFDVNVIPHTRQLTTLGRLEENDFANIEVDQIARYLERLMETSNRALAR